MSFQEEPLWASGPGEILRHGIALLSEDSDTNRRLAMISIDNAVELTMQTYIQLPRRITGLNISRKDRDEICATFPSLLDGIETHASEKIIGINLGEIEWFHRLRNELYHQGNGLTVERRNVEVYAELAAVFFRSLFGVRLKIAEKGKMHLLGEFLEAYASIELAIRHATTGIPSLTSGRAVLAFVKDGVLDRQEFEKFEEIRNVRNMVVHQPSGSELITQQIVDSTQEIARKMHAAFPEVPT